MMTADTMDFGAVTRRADGSYIIDRNGMPYHVPNEGDEWQELWAEVDAYAQANPEKVTLEPEPKEILPTKPEAVAQKTAEIMTAYEAAFAPFEVVYPAHEREGWPIQLEEARVVLADPAAEVPTLSAMVAERYIEGETVADLARAVMANNATYRALYASLTGQQQRMCADVMAMSADECMTAEDVLGYPVEYVVPVVG